MLCCAILVERWKWNLGRGLPSSTCAWMAAHFPFSTMLRCQGRSILANNALWVSQVSRFTDHSSTHLLVQHEWLGPEKFGREDFDIWESTNIGKGTIFKHFLPHFKASLPWESHHEGILSKYCLQTQMTHLHLCRLQSPPPCTQLFRSSRCQVKGAAHIQDHW